MQCPYYCRVPTQICIQHKQDREFVKRVDELKMTRIPLKNLIDNLSSDGRYRQNTETLNKLRHLYSIITGQNQLSNQLAFLNEHDQFLLSLAGLSMPHLNLTERHRRMKEKREKLARMKSKLDYFTRCKCGVKYGKPGHEMMWSSSLSTSNNNIKGRKTDINVGHFQCRQCQSSTPSRQRLTTSTTASSSNARYKGKRRSAKTVDISQSVQIYTWIKKCPESFSLWQVCICCKK